MGEFKGRITEISTIKTGKTKKDDDWASLDFEITESEPNNELYPQIALFSFFKMGEYFKFANDFNDFYKLGDEVVVEYNFKLNKYTKKDGTEGKFYKNDCWKLQKVTEETVQNAEVVQTTDSNEPDDLPF